MVCSLPAVYRHQRISNSDCIGTRGNFFTASRRRDRGQLSYPEITAIGMLSLYCPFIAPEGVSFETDRSSYPCRKW